jgi:hypothetical protein
LLITFISVSFRGVVRRWHRQTDRLMQRSLGRETGEGL